MASPFLPQQQVPDQGSAQPSEPPPDQNGLSKRWGDWIDKPENRASLMQFGISMMQPVGFGQSFGGQFANSIGEAGGAASRVESQALEREKESSMAKYRKKIAEARETTAGAAETRAERGPAGGEITPAKKLTATIQMQREYRKYVEDPLRDPKKPVKPFRQWLEEDADPELAMTLGVAPAETRSLQTSPSAPAAAPLPQQNAPAPKQVAPTQAQIDKLRMLRDNPQAIAAFDQQFGPGSAARYMR